MVAFLIVLILGKAVGMADWGAVGSSLSFNKSMEDGRQKAADYLLEIWNLHYPVGKAAWLIENDNGQTVPVFSWMINPVRRFLAMEDIGQTGYQEADPSYERYLSTQVFYQEHQYLAYYGDEETHQEQVTEDTGPPQIQYPEVVEIPESAVVQTTGISLPVIGTRYAMEQLADYDFLMKHFYNVHTSTTAKREEMNAKTLLDMDLSITKDSSQPQILIYHTHSQETYADYSADHPEATITEVGTYLTELLRAKGYNVIHDTSVYDLKDGALDRSKAYTYALDGITGILQQNPSIQVVLDLHRDGVKEGVHLVSEVNGKQTASVMFFNGMSQTPAEDIEYLQNPYKEENLAFSLQMQLEAAAYYPGLTRKIYLKGLRYNLHMRPRSSLIEVGAQTNTLEEAKNAMEPLAELLDMVLKPVE